jgi:hypothetical protein
MASVDQLGGMWLEDRDRVVGAKSGAVMDAVRAVETRDAIRSLMVPGGRSSRIGR